ncbi:ABC transporter permease subunit [Streptomyces noursei]|uniref:ABC transporter permease subunit n=1 Tax=Streptomyces noursei TaxID=1971 RepID=UPI0027E46236|nr:ABC transporter permease subunit [Streptomyces noursei]
MTSPQQPQPQPAPGAQPMPPAVPAPAPSAGPMPPAVPPQPAPAQPAPAEDAGTMMLQAQPPAPAPPAPAKEAGTMLLQAQPPAGGHPEPTPLSAHGPGKEAGTMLLTAAAQPPAPPHPGPAPQHASVPQQQAPAPAPAPAPAANWQAATPGYVSPIPVRPTHLGHALAAEWTKIRSVRSTVWTLGVMTVLVLGIGVLVAVSVASMSTVGDTSPLFFGLFGMLLGVLCVLPLGVLVTSSEYGTGMIRTTLAACPNRGRVLTAKALVFFALTFVVTTVVTGLVALTDNAMISDISRVHVGAGEWLRSTVGIGLYVSFLGLLALAVGSLIRHSAGAITLMVGVVLLPFVLSMFMFADSLEGVRNFLMGYSIPNQLTVMYGNKFPFVDGGPSGWQPLWIVMGLAAVALGAAYATMRQRDV